MIISQKFRQATSLIELVVSIGIMAMVVLIVVNLYVGSGRFTTAENLRIDVGDNASRVLATMDETLREGRSVISSAMYDSVTYTTGDTTVVLTTPSLVDGALSPSEVDTMILYLDSANPSNKHIRRIIATVGTGSTRTIGVSDVVQGVKDVYFRYTTDTLTARTVVTATVTIEKTVNGKPFTTAMILNATLRNHP